MKKKIIIIGVFNLFFGGIIFILLFFMIIGGGSAASKNDNTGTNIGDYSGIKQLKPNMSQQQFINAMSKPAIDTYNQYGVFASVTIAQSILESGWGNTGLPKISNNLFGIKAYNWTGDYVELPTNEVYNGMTEMITDKFRVYSSWEESVMDHGKFLSENTTYRQHGVFLSKDYVEQANALKNAGYATEPSYPMLLITLIKEYDLDRYDKQ